MVNQDDDKFTVISKDNIEIKVSRKTLMMVPVFRDMLALALTSNAPNPTPDEQSSPEGKHDDKASIRLDDSSPGLEIFFGLLDSTFITDLEALHNSLLKDYGQAWISAVSIADKYDVNHLKLIMIGTLCAAVHWKHHQATSKSRMVIAIFLKSPGLLSSTIAQERHWSDPEMWSWEMVSHIDSQTWYLINKNIYWHYRDEFRDGQVKFRPYGSIDGKILGQAIIKAFST